MNPIAALVLVVTVLAGGYALLHLLGRRFHWSPEFRRKSVHIALGLVCLSFPWLFHENWPVVLLGAIALIALALLRLLPRTGNSLASALHNVNRSSFGELFFPAVVVWTFLAAGGQLVLYVVPIAILTLADAGGALLGVRYGKKHFTTLGSGKTIEGSLTFFLIGVLCTLVPLLGFSDLPFLNVILISCILGGLATLVEGFSSHGSDNLLLPVACLLILEVFLSFPPEILFIRLVVLASLVVVLVLLNRFTSLDGGGLLSCILFGYACFALGNIWFLTVAFVFYLFHLVNTWRVKKLREVGHRIDTVLAITSTGLVWLTLHRLDIIPPDTAFLCFTLGMAGHLTMTSCGTALFLNKPTPGYGRAILKGAVLVLLGLAIRQSNHPDPPAILGGMVAFPLLLLPAAFLFVRWRGNAPDSRSLYHLKQTLLALPYSALGLFADSLP